MIQRLITLKYVLLSLILIQIAIIIAISVDENYEKKIFLDHKTQLSKITYNTVYKKTKEQSEMIFHENINTKEIIDIYKHAYKADEKTKIILRKKLYDKLIVSYTRLNTLINLRQVHFHLPNNQSFLRMHRPKKFGDDLSKVRSTVAYVNKSQKNIDGFEEGRIYNGFRFVYPLFDANNSYIGSVEVSFSTLGFQKTLSNGIQFAQFIFSKNIIEEKVWKDEYKLNYRQAAISPMFLFASNSMNDAFGSIKKEIMKNMSQSVRDTFALNFKDEKAFSQPIEVNDTIYVLSFLPIQNPVTHELVAYLVIITQTNYFHQLHFGHNFLKLVSFAFLFSLFVIIYIYKRYEDNLHQKQILLQEQSKMAQMGSMLSNISHQWKQPLAQINSKLIMLPLSLELNSQQNKLLRKHIEDIEDLTHFMANTIEDFRTYFSPNKEKNYFNLLNTVEKSLSILKLEKEIKTTILGDPKLRIKCFENELIQVLITLLINAKEAFINQEIDTPRITIKVVSETSSISIIIIDNAGGIDSKIIKQIFNPYFSTKTSQKNAGIGLYMAKMIIEGMQGSLSYEMINKESHFTISLRSATNG